MGAQIARLQTIHFFEPSLLNPDSSIGMVGQQNFSILLGAHGLFWIEGIASYFEIQNGSKCLRLKKNEVE
jgi:hypothetical protein